MTNAEHTAFLKIKALSKAIDALIVTDYEESENEIIVLSQMLTESCEQLDNITE